jgi:RNA polymerase sigma-70 factor (ECF subfamily)
VGFVRRARAGDGDAFEALYHAHVDGVFRLITRLVGPDSEREDLVQQVFLELHRALPGFRGESLFSTWLHRIVVRVAYDHLRRRRRRPVVALKDEDLEALIAPDETPEAAARQRELLRQALGLLDRIKPKKRIAFLLRVVEGLSLEEIGEIVGAKPPAVGQRVKHAERELEGMIARAERREGST